MNDIEVGKVYTFTPEPDWGEPWNVAGVIQIVSLSEGVAEYDVLEGMSRGLRGHTFHLNSQFADHLSLNNDYATSLNADVKDFDLDFDSLLNGVASEE